MGGLPKKVADESHGYGNKCRNFNFCHIASHLLISSVSRLSVTDNCANNEGITSTVGCGLGENTGENDISIPP